MVGEWKSRIGFGLALLTIAFAMTATVTHFKRAYPKSVTATVTSQRLELPAFQPFAFWGVTPTAYIPMAKGFEPARYGVIAGTRRVRKRKWVCYDRLNTFPPTGRAQVCGVSVFWI